MIAAGWSDSAVAGAVREMLAGWYRLLREVAEREARRLGGLGPFTSSEVSMLMGLPFLGAESALLLGLDETEFPTRSALRKLGALILAAEGDARPTEEAAR
jgi:hypothetical protein